MFYKKYILAAAVFISLLIIQNGCVRYPSYSDPDIESFKNIAEHSALIDSLENGKLTSGMPYYLVEEIFKNWPAGQQETKIPVASLGSRQKLIETEGWGRVYSDPNIRVFMDEYDTGKGKLYVWYQYPDFYRTDVSQGDTLVVFCGDSTESSVVSFLRKSNVLTVANKLTPDSSGNFYGEIHYNDHPWRRVTYWYSLRLLSDGKTVMIKDLQYNIYPVELLELNGERIQSFNWR